MHHILECSHSSTSSVRSQYHKDTKQFMKRIIYTIDLVIHS